MPDGTCAPGHFRGDLALISSLVVDVADIGHYWRLRKEVSHERAARCSFRH